MKQILPGFHTFTGFVIGHVYLIEDADGLTLIDASIRPSGGVILNQLKAKGHAPTDVKRILITHAHPDHIGALPALKKATGAQVMASTLETPVIEGKQDVARRPKNPRPPKTAFPGTPVDRVINDGETLPEVMGGLQALHTPGHAPGHTAYWQPEKRILICGDVMFHLFNRITLPPAFLTVDMDENKRSVAKLLALEPAVICFGHGEPLTENATEKMRAFAQRIGII